MEVKLFWIHGLTNLFLFILGILDPNPTERIDAEFMPPLLLAATPLLLFPIARIVMIHEFSIREKSDETISFRIEPLKRFVVGFWSKNSVYSKSGSFSWYGFSYAVDALISNALQNAGFSFAGLFVLVASLTIFASEESACRKWNKGMRSPVL